MNEIDSLLYNTPNLNTLSRNSSSLLKKYRNNRPKTVMIMNRYKRRRSLLNKGLDLVKIYKYSPGNSNAPVNAGNITTKRGQSIANYLRGKTTMKNENTGDLFATKMVVAKKPFTFLIHSSSFSRNMSYPCHFISIFIKFHQHTLEYQINVGYGINVALCFVVKINKHRL